MDIRILGLVLVVVVVLGAEFGAGLASGAIIPRGCLFATLAWAPPVAGVVALTFAFFGAVVVVEARTGLGYPRGPYDEILWSFLTVLAYALGVVVGIAKGPRIDWATGRVHGSTGGQVGPVPTGGRESPGYWAERAPALAALRADLDAGRIDDAEYGRRRAEILDSASSDSIGG